MNARENGFTLIELMVALFVFGLLASAGLVLLRSSADGQAVLSERLGDNGRMIRISTLMRHELAQALPRVSRNAGGAQVAAFDSFAIAPGTLFTFTRAGTRAGGGVEGGGITRITYAFDGGALQRTVWPHPDGVQGAAPAKVLEDLASVKAEFRDAGGNWQGAWKSATPTELPRAVRLTLTDKDGVVTQIAAAVGPQFRPVAAVVAAPTDAAPPVDGEREL